VKNLTPLRKLIALPDVTTWLRPASERCYGEF